MASGPRYRVPFRRRREGRTDYRRRAALLRSGAVRLVVRKSNKHVRVQFVDYHEKGDRVLASAISKELEKHGWTASGKSTPGAYLTGYLAGKRAKEKGLSEAVLDIGLREPTRGAVVFAALKGALDAGIEVPHSEEMIPSQERLEGKHMKHDGSEMFKAVKAKIGGG